MWPPHFPMLTGGIHDLSWISAHKWMWFASFVCSTHFLVKWMCAVTWNEANVHSVATPQLAGQTWPILFGLSTQSQNIILFATFWLAETAQWLAAWNPLSCHTLKEKFGSMKTLVSHAFFGVWSFLCYELTAAHIMLMACVPGTVTVIKQQLDSSHLHHLASQRQKMATMPMKTTCLKRLHLKKTERKKNEKKMRCRNAFIFQHISLKLFYFVNLTSSCLLIPTHIHTSYIKTHCW